LIRIIFIVGKSSEDADTTHVLNLTSTFAALLDLSIPYSNTGTMIPHIYVFETPNFCSSFYKNLVDKYYKNLEQILGYRENYFNSQTIRGTF